jgi:hypothetical protein
VWVSKCVKSEQVDYLDKRTLVRGPWELWCWVSSILASAISKSQSLDRRQRRNPEKQRKLQELELVRHSSFARGVPRLTTAKERVINLNITRPAFCFRISKRVPLSSYWIALNKTDQKSHETDNVQPYSHRHYRPSKPALWAEDANE